MMERKGFLELSDGLMVYQIKPKFNWQKERLDTHIFINRIRKLEKW